MTRVGFTSFFASTAFLLAAACGGSPSSQKPEAQSVEVTVTPETANVAPSGTKQFAAQVVGAVSTAVAWDIVEGVAGGSVSTTGLYTAPGAAGTFHVRAISVADPTKSGSATVTVAVPPPVVTVAIAPTSAAVDACGTRAFTATVTGSTNTAVTWTVQEVGGGTVATNGTYTAPANDGTYHVVATSAADPTKTAVVPVTVTSRVLSVAVTPATISVTAGGTAAFTANVTTTCGTVAVHKVIDSSGKVVAD